MRIAHGHLLHAAVVTFLVLHAVAARAADGENVEVLPPLTKVVATVPELRDLCRGAGQYDACTRMVAYRLEASCTQQRGEWRIEATARFRPFVILKNVQKLSHEHEHIEDIRRSADRYVSALQSMTFAALAACEAHGLAERASFEMSMATFALDSNLARHPQLRQVAKR